MRDFGDNAGAETVGHQQPFRTEGEDLQASAENQVALSLESIEAVMLQEPQVECPVQHHFGPGIYIREAFLPAGTYVMGHAHKTEHMNVMLKGKMAVIVNGEAKVIEGPYIFTGQPGRKFAYIIEDTVFQNIYATTETDLDKIEDMFVDKSNTWLDAQADAESMQAIEAVVHQHFEGVSS
jgi:hypothetical protein